MGSHPKPRPKDLHPRHPDYDLGPVTFIAKYTCPSCGHPGTLQIHDHTGYCSNTNGTMGIVKDVAQHNAHCMFWCDECMANLQLMIYDFATERPTVGGTFRHGAELDLMPPELPCLLCEDTIEDIPEELM